MARLQGLVAQKETERSRVVALYWRGRLTDAELDEQMDEIAKEEAALEAQIAELSSKITSVDSVESSINSAQALLERLRKRLDQPISWEMKRRLVEVLVAGVSVETVEEDGATQARITVAYRFSEPDQPMALALPQAYGSTGLVIRIPTQPETVGDHIRKRRLGLKMLQRETAERLEVTESSLWNWEANSSHPELRYMPAIIQFLGYNPLPEATDLGGRLVRRRISLGLSQKEAAKRLGVDPGTLARWERRETEPTGAMLDSVTRFLSGDGEEGSRVRRVG